MQKGCRKCGKKEKTLYKVSVGWPKAEGDFCNECVNKWFDLRDKLVVEAFRDYIAGKLTS